MKSGDKVQWTQTSHKGRSFSAVLKRGIFVSAENGIARVLTLSGKTIEVTEVLLQPEGMKSDIIEFVELLRNSNV